METGFLTVLTGTVVSKIVAKQLSPMVTVTSCSVSKGTSTVTALMDLFVHKNSKIAFYKKNKNAYESSNTSYCQK